MSYLYLPLTAIAEEPRYAIDDDQRHQLLASSAHLAVMYDDRKYTLCEYGPLTPWVMALPCVDPRMCMNSDAGSSRYRVPSVSVLQAAFKAQPEEIRKVLCEYRWAAERVGNFTWAVTFDAAGAIVGKLRAPIVGNKDVMLWPELKNTVMGGVLD